MVVERKRCRGYSAPKTGALCSVAILSPVAMGLPGQRMALPHTGEQMQALFRKMDAFLEGFNRGGNGHLSPGI